MEEQSGVSRGSSVHPGPVFRRILVAIDFTPASVRALDVAADLAGKLGAALTVLHVYHLPEYYFPEGSVIPTAEDAARVGQAAEASLEAAIAPLKAKGLEVTGSLVSGRPAEEITAHASAIAADLIVVGTHGKGVVAAALLGSVARDVIRLARCPVLSVPPRPTG